MKVRLLAPAPLHSPAHHLYDICNKIDLPLPPIEESGPAPMGTDDNQSVRAAKDGASVLQQGFGLEPHDKVAPVRSVDVDRERQIV